MHVSPNYVCYLSKFFAQFLIDGNVHLPEVPEVQLKGRSLGKKLSFKLLISNNDFVILSSWFTALYYVNTGLNIMKFNIRLNIHALICII